MNYSYHVSVQICDDKIFIDYCKRMSLVYKIIMVSFTGFSTMSTMYTVEMDDKDLLLMKLALPVKILALKF